MSIEAMKQALEALETCHWDYDSEEESYKTFDEDLVNNAVEALRQAIEQAEKPVEPPDYVEPVTTDYHEGWEEGFKAGNALVPPKREWVGLTDEEIQQAVYDLGTIGDLSHDEFDIARAVIAKLKEKNT